MSVIVDQTSQVLMRDGKAVRLSPVECSIVARLVQIGPGHIKYKELSQHVGLASSSLGVRLWELRRKLKRLRLGIAHGNSNGGVGLIVHKNA